MLEIEEIRIFIHSKQSRIIHLFNDPEIPLLRLYANKYTHTQQSVQLCVYMGMYVNVCVCLCMCTCVYVFTNIHHIPEKYPCLSIREYVCRYLQQYCDSSESKAAYMFFMSKEIKCAHKMCLYTS